MVRPKPKTLTSKHATGRGQVLLTERNCEQDHAYMRWWSGWVDGESGWGMDGHIATHRTLSGTCYAKTYMPVNIKLIFSSVLGHCRPFVGHKWPVFSISSPNLASDTIEAFPLKVLLLFLSVDFLLCIRTGGLHVHDCTWNFFQTCDMWILKPCDDPTSCTCFNPLTAAVCVWFACTTGECVLQRAVMVRKKLTAREGRGWLSGTLLCTHFRVAFVPEDSPKPEVSPLWAPPLMYRWNHLWL